MKSYSRYFFALAFFSLNYFEILHYCIYQWLFHFYSWVGFHFINIPVCLSTSYWWALGLFPVLIPMNISILNTFLGLIHIFCILFHMENDRAFILKFRASVCYWIFLHLITHQATPSNLIFISLFQLPYFCFFFN